ncbi:hypothetical protein EV122DRAFT_187308, partial [Schizophyllum commune]
IVPEEHVFDKLTPTSMSVETANKNAPLKVVGSGNATFLLPPLDNGERVSMTLRNALHAPDAPCTLVSIPCIEKAGFSCNIAKGKMTIRDPNNELIACIPRVRNLY